MYVCVYIFVYYIYSSMFTDVDVKHGVVYFGTKFCNDPDVGGFISCSSVSIVWYAVR